MKELTNTSSSQAGLIDIVAVQGLNADREEAWTGANGRLWLRDFLPNQVPARVLSFGYGSGVDVKQSVAGIDDDAHTLLDQLRLARLTPQEKARQIIFIGHSLGGAVVKQALILAHERPDKYKNILDHTRAIAFFGVPHRGLSSGSGGVLVANILKYASLGTSTRAGAVVDLRKESSTLQTISDQFIDYGKDLVLYSFYETKMMNGMNTMIVDKYSACLGLPNEKLVPLDATHRTMCKLESATGQAYKLVGGSIVEMINRAQR